MHFVIELNTGRPGISRRFRMKSVYEIPGMAGCAILIILKRGIVDPNPKIKVH
jgi:hypothetical protein